jgi:hypothetical protein
MFDQMNSPEITMMTQGRQLERAKEATRRRHKQQNTRETGSWVFK